MSIDINHLFVGHVPKNELFTYQNRASLKRRGFEAKVGVTFLFSQNLEAIAKLIVKECVYLPLAIITIGTSMKGVVNKREWRNALKKLRESTRGSTK